MYLYLAPVDKGWATEEDLSDIKTFYMQIAMNFLW